MGYNFGDKYFICDTCGGKLECSIYSSGGYTDAIRSGWKEDVKEIIHIIPEQIIKSKFMGNRIIREHKKIEKIIILECDRCVSRKKKLKKIKEKMGI
jgi:hypothetical protein